MQPIPGPDRVQALIGDSRDSATIEDLLGKAARAAHIVTGGAGFDESGSLVAPDLADVLVRSVARSLVNPEVALAEVEPPFSVHPGSFADWSDADFIVLQHYRDQAAEQIREP